MNSSDDSPASESDLVCVRCGHVSELADPVSPATWDVHWGPLSAVCTSYKLCQQRFEAQQAALGGSLRERAAIALAAEPAEQRSYELGYRRRQRARLERRAREILGVTTAPCGSSADGDAIESDGLTITLPDSVEEQGLIVSWFSDDGTRRSHPVRTLADLGWALTEVEQAT